MTIHDLKIGDQSTYTRQITTEHIETFAALCGDSNPVHLNDAYAEQTVFKGRIAYGMLVAGLISTIIGSQLPGDGSIYLSQDLKFVKPVMANDTITAEVTVEALDIDKNRITLNTRCYNQAGEDVITGGALVKLMPPKI